MFKVNVKDGFGGGIVLNQFWYDFGFGGQAWAGRKYDGIKIVYFFEGNGVIVVYGYFLFQQFLNVLYQIEGERIVIIENEYVYVLEFFGFVQCFGECVQFVIDFL